MHPTLKSVGCTVSLSPGSPAPDFEAPTPMGGFIRLYSIARGSLVVLVFTGSLRDLAPFSRLQGEYSRLGARVVGVASVDPRRARAAVRRLGLRVTVACDPDGRIAGAYGVAWRLGPLLRVRTTTFILDDGVVVEVLGGEGAGRQALRALDTLRARLEASRG